MTTLTLEDFKAYHGDNDLVEAENRVCSLEQQYGELRCEYQSSVSAYGDAWAGADQQLAQVASNVARWKAIVESHYKYH